MGFWTELRKAWETSRAEKEWNKKVGQQMKNLDRKPIGASFEQEKAAFTAKGEPWVGIIRMDVDPNNLSDGVFELDWNEIFVARLVKAGYTGRDDKAIVDQWFQNICSSVVSGTFEQEMADPEKRRMVQRRKLEKNRTEFS